jgi:hypothetical protein
VGKRYKGLNVTPDLVEVLVWAEGNGWRVVPPRGKPLGKGRGGCSFALYGPDGQGPVFTRTTLSDHRAPKNFKALLRRLGRGAQPA